MYLIFKLQNDINMATNTVSDANKNAIKEIFVSF